MGGGQVRVLEGDLGTEAEPAGWGPKAEPAATTVCGVCGAATRERAMMGSTASGGTSVWGTSADTAALREL